MRSALYSRRVSQWLRWIPLVLGVIALGYVITVASENLGARQLRWERFSVRGALITFAAVTAPLFLLAYAWHWVLRQLGIKISLPESFHAWFTSNLYKYIPGQIWAPVGRTVIAASHGVPARATVMTTGLEYGFSILSATLILLAALGQLVLAALVALLSLALIHPRAVRLVKSLGDRVMRRPVELVPLGSRQLGLLLLVSYVSLGFGVLALAGVLVCLGIFELSLTRTCAVALTSSFLGGLFFFGAPAGLGVREAALVVVLTRSGLTAVEASTAALLLRLATILGDTVCFAVAGCVFRWRLPRRDDKQ